MVLYNEWLKEQNMLFANNILITTQGVTCSHCGSMLLCRESVYDWEAVVTTVKIPGRPRHSTTVTSLPHYHTAATGHHMGEREVGIKIKELKQSQFSYLLLSAER